MAAYVILSITCFFIAIAFGPLWYLVPGILILGINIWLRLHIVKTYSIIQNGPCLEGTTACCCCCCSISQSKLISFHFKYFSYLFHRQNEFLRVGSTPPYLFSVFYQDIQGDVKHLGDYTIHTISKRNSFEGFSYYEFKLIRRFKARLELPNLPTLQYSLLAAVDAVNNERE
jgi:hypothetical protein